MYLRRRPKESHAWNRQSTCGLVAMTSASRAEGRQFDPGQVYGRTKDPIGPVQSSHVDGAGSPRTGDQNMLSSPRRRQLHMWISSERRAWGCTCNWVHSSVVRAADCRSAGPWLKSGCALCDMLSGIRFVDNYWVHSSVVRAAECRSAGPWLKSGCALCDTCVQYLVELLRPCHRP